MWYILISSKNNRQCPCSIGVQGHPWVALSACRDICECVHTTTGLVLIIRALVRGGLSDWEAHLWERPNGSGSFPQAGELHRMKGADSVRQPVRAFFQSASWLPQAPHHDGLKSLRERDSFLLWSLQSGILLHSWKVLTDSTSHCMNTRKMQKAVQAAKVEEGRDQKTESGPGVSGAFGVALVVFRPSSADSSNCPPPFWGSSNPLVFCLTNGRTQDTGSCAQLALWFYWEFKRVHSSITHMEDNFV